ncbi:MAG: hypothetical protein LUH63_06275 [Parabacteroides sp.]|nr:hypothetical protein [Parabacteroides sp.]
MEYEDKKYILRKLVQDALTEEEQIALQSSRRVIRQMERQWDSAPRCYRERPSGRTVYLAEY